MGTETINSRRLREYLPREIVRVPVAALSKSRDVSA